VPYIKDENGKREDPSLETPGELNYIICKICLEYEEHHMKEGKESYKLHNEIMGVLECAKLEWYRRKVAPYEDKKIEENGDIF